MRRLIPTAAVAAAVIALAGCAPASPVHPGSGAGGTFVGTWVADEPARGDVPTLILDANGELGGNDGCNVMFGRWSASGSTAEFSELGGTLRFCEHVDDWLIRAATGELDGDTLTIFGADGAELGELHRAA